MSITPDEVRERLTALLDAHPYDPESENPELRQPYTLIHAARELYKELSDEQLGCLMRWPSCSPRAFRHAEGAMGVYHAKSEAVIEGLVCDIMLAHASHDEDLMEAHRRRLELYHKQREVSLTPAI